MSSKERTKLIKNFENSKNGIFFLTYQLGAEGLNLQFASTVLLVNYWWNSSKTSQANGRNYQTNRTIGQRRTVEENQVLLMVSLFGKKY